MVTLQTADNALKSFYLDAITREIDEKSSVFLSMIEKTSANVAGKEVKKVVKTGVHSSIGAGTETGDIPKGDSGDYVVLSAPLKNLYGTIEISDKAIRASASNEGAFVNILNEEMEGLVKSAKYNFGRMLFGDGSGMITTISKISDNEIILGTVQGIEVGMLVDIWFDGEKFFEKYKVATLDRTKKMITLTDATGAAASGLMVGATLCLHGTEPGYELTGLSALFGNKGIYSADKNKPYMQPYTDADSGELDEEIIQKAMDSIEDASGSPVNLIICSWGVRRALLQMLRNSNQTITTVKLGENVSALSYNGVPVVVDRFCPSNTMYFLNTNDFKLCQLCDWQWMEGEDGKILKQVAGKPVYTATLVKYAELICEKPCGQGVLTNIIEK